MKATIRFNKTLNTVGDLTFNKTLNLYKIARKKGTIYLPAHTLDYAVEVPSTKRKSTSRRRKK